MFSVALRNAYEKQFPTEPVVRVVEMKEEKKKEQKITRPQFSNFLTAQRHPVLYELAPKLE